jgi:hypothetical protein
MSDSNITDQHPDFLSPLCRQIMDAATYDKLVVHGATPTKARELLDGVTPEQLFTVPIDSLGHAYAMLAGLWLLHDALHESHELAQADLLPHAIPHAKPSKLSKTGEIRQSMEIDKGRWERELAQALNSFAFWHAIIHRREGDFSNAKYWYGRCADHRAMRLISSIGMDLVGRDAADESLLQIVAGEYKPDALVDLVEGLHDKPADSRMEAAIRIQQLEWEALFNHCAYEATGAAGGMV